MAFNRGRVTLKPTWIHVRQIKMNVERPTARWVFLKFEAIDTLEFNGPSFITGVQEHQIRLLKLLGTLYEAIYP